MCVQCLLPTDGQRFALSALSFVLVASMGAELVQAAELAPPVPVSWQNAAIAFRFSTGLLWLWILLQNWVGVASRDR